MGSLAGPWALGRFARPDGEVIVGALAGDRVLDIASASAALEALAGLGINGLLADWETARREIGRAAGDASQGQWWPLAELTVRAPVEPRQVIQAGANYRSHVIDLAVKHAELAGGRAEQQVRAETAAMMDRRAAGGDPYLFLGLPSAVTGPYDEVVLPACSSQPDWELELAAVIGAPAFRVSRADALGHVAGYTIVNDLTMRDLVFRLDMPEIGTDWFRAKNAPGFLPTGPYLVPASFAGDPRELRLTLELNGQVMQDESAKDMIFDVAALVAAASRTTTLLPGDLLLTGSPAGNGLHWGRLLRDGDEMVGRISGLGAQRTRCVAEAAQ
jgi:2,4-didehydro-3-deoxy-L-rhamnonate hydrolase